MQNNTIDKKPIRLVFLVIPTVLIVITTLFVLYISGFFMSPTDKLEGQWKRTRIGEYSGKEYTETYIFSPDGTGVKTYLDKDGYESKSEFSWEITENKTLIINNKVKYNWNADYADYYSQLEKPAKKYWFATKNQLYIGEDTSLTYELYEKSE